MLSIDKEQQAIKQAKRLKAFRIGKNNKTDFLSIYFSIQNEVKLYDNKDKNNQLTKSSADSAKVWLSRYSKILKPIGEGR